MEQDQGLEQALSLEKQIELFINTTDARLLELQRRRTYGARACPYTVPLKPAAGCVDRLRLKSEMDVKKVGMSLSRLRQQLTHIHREVQEAQRSQYKYLKTKPRRTEYAQQLRQALAERAEAQQQLQERRCALNDRGEDHRIEDILTSDQNDEDSDYDDGIDIEPDLC